MKKHTSVILLLFLASIQLGCMMWGFVNHSWTAILATLSFAFDVMVIYKIIAE